MDERPRVLVVDDDSHILGIVAFLLSRENLEVKLAGNGEEAIDTAKESHPDLIILDVMMPGMDGFETCKAIKAEPDLEPIPVIFLTAKKGPKHWSEADKSGAVAYIEKPFKNEALLSLVRQLLENPSP